MIQSGNWRGACDTARELEESTLCSLGTGGYHVIQSGNWRGARDPARELEGARDAGNSS